MVHRRLAVIVALGMAVAVPSLVSSVEKTKSTGAKKPAATKPAPTAKPAAPATPDATKPTQENNLKKFKTAPDSTVVAVVNDEKITKGDLMGVLFDWSAPLTLDEYINHRIVVQAMKKQGIQVTEADINKKVEEIKKTQIPPGETLESMLQRIKWPMARFRAFVTNQIGMEKMIEKETNPTDQDYAEFVKARQIVVRVTSTPNATPEDREKADKEASEKASKIVAEIRAGKAFEEAVKEYSDDQATKERGGELNWFRRNEQMQEVSNTAFRLKPGEIADPVKTFLGYHIIKVDKFGGDATAAERKDLREQMIKSKTAMRMRTLGDELRKSAKIENRISPQLPEPQRPGMAPEGPRPSPAESQGTARPAAAPKATQPKDGEAAKPAPPPTPPAQPEAPKQ